MGGIMRGCLLESALCPVVVVVAAHGWLTFRLGFFLLFFHFLCSFSFWGGMYFYARSSSYRYAADVRVLSISMETF
jgi:hypothetical protein